MAKKKTPASSSSGARPPPPPPTTTTTASSSPTIDHKKIDHDPSVIEELKPITHEPFNLKISELVYTMRVQNGLRHNDAIRYHKYCTRRLAHLRSKLKHKNGRHRFVAKPIPNDFNDPRFLHLLMVTTERSYAFHLEMKNAQSTPPNANGLIQTNCGNVKPNQLIHWSRRRLAKAVVNATRLVDYCERHCDKQTILEAKAYRELLAGMLAGEKRQWESSMESLLESRRLYVQLAGLASAEPTHAAAVNDQLNAIDLHLRTASYYLARMGVDVSSLRLNVEQQGETSQTAASPSQLTSLYWRGIQISLPEELTHSAKLDEISSTIASNLIPAQSLLSYRDHNVQQLLSALSAQPKAWQQTTENYLAMQKATEQSLSLIHASLLDSDTSGESETGHFFLLETLARDYQQCSLIEMNLMLLILGLLEYLQTSVPGTSKSFNHCPPSFGVFLSDLVVQLMSSLISELNSTRCPSKIQDSLAASVEVLQGHFSAWKQIAHDCRAIFVCLSMIGTKKQQEAYVLINSILQSRSRSDRFDIDLALPDSKLWIDSPYFRLGAAVTLLDSVLSHAEPRVEVDAAAALVTATSTDDVSSNVKDTDVVKKLSEKLNFPGELKLKPIPCKPILFDLAEPNILPPTLSKSGAATPSSGLVGKLASWWRK